MLYGLQFSEIQIKRYYPIEQFQFFIGQVILGALRFIFVYAGPTQLVSPILGRDASTLRKIISAAVCP